MQSAKFLGVIINQNLSWKPHIEMICSKTSKVIGLICKARQYLHSNTLKTLYNSLFLPYVNYCNLIWASTYNSHINPLLLLQKLSVSSPFHLHGPTPNPYFRSLTFYLFSLFTSFKSQPLFSLTLINYCPLRSPPCSNSTLNAIAIKLAPGLIYINNFWNAIFLFGHKHPQSGTVFPYHYANHLTSQILNWNWRLTFSLSNITVYQEETLLLL